MKKLIFTFLCMAAIGLAVPQQAGAQAHFRGGHAGVRFYAAPRIGFAYNPFWYGPRWGYYGYYGYGPYGWPIDNHGGVRLQVTPKTAAVYVDGGYAGTVDQFDGHFQHLDLTPGAHTVVVQQPGFQPLTFQTYVQPGHTTDYKAALTPGAR